MHSHILIGADLPTLQPALLPAHPHANTLQYNIFGRSTGRQACVYPAGLYPAGLLSMPDMEYLFCCGGSGGLAPRRRLMTGPLPKDGVRFRPESVGLQVGRSALRQI